MLTDESVPAEAARYAAPLVLVPGLWSGRAVWRGFATYLAHRGWECRLVDLRGTGGLGARVEALRAYLGTLPAPAVLVGHGAGGLVAHEAGDGAAAVVMAAPLIPGDPATRNLLLERRNVLGVALGRRVGPPGAAALALVAGELTDAERAGLAGRLGPDDGGALRDLLRARVAPRPASVPTLVVAGARDPLLAPAAAQALAARLGADLEQLPEAGHWLLAGRVWQAAVGVIHRWVVQRLGEPLLETYAEAMADRETEE